MYFSPKLAVSVFLSLVVGLSAIPASSFAQKPPPPPKRGDGNPPPRPGDDRPPKRGGKEVNESKINSGGSRQVLGEVWVDNWFKLYINGEPLLEDSVSIRTERSFNAERFEFGSDFPMTIAFEFRDFMENDTGLEYIGSRRQQLGDGGAIAQFKDAASGKLIAATGSDWRCLTVQAAPADASCARERNPDVTQDVCAQTRVAVPENWTAPGFDDSNWPKASVYSASDVGPKDGYNQIQWDSSAELIWGKDLKKDNIVYCRAIVGG